MPTRKIQDRIQFETSGQPTVLAIASAGGHIVQLCRLMPAWEGCTTVIATTSDGYQGEVEAVAESCGQPKPSYAVVTGGSRWQKFSMVRSLIDVLLLLVRVRPDVVITTGAAPGFLALRLAPVVKSRTIWIDSIANSDELSLSGKMAGKYADLWLTQWDHLAGPDGPDFRGSVL